jgi:hypothetical protein
MSMTQRLLIPGFVSVFALVACTENPYDTPYDPYGRTRTQRPPYGSVATPGYGTPQTPSPYGTAQTPGPYGTAPSPYSPSGPATPSPAPTTPNPYGSLQPLSPVTPPVTPPATGTTPGNYPVATRTKNPGFVVSPYDANRVIDVSEFRSGQLVRDPENKKIFRVP